MIFPAHELPRIHPRLLLLALLLTLGVAANTHQHDDHAGGDLKMLPLAEVIAHRNARANLIDIKQPYYEDTPGTR